MPDRMEKIDEIVKREVASSLLDLFRDSFISVTDVEVSKDLAYAKIWIRSIGDVNQTVIFCQEKAPEITASLAKKLKTRRVPKITFIADTAAERVDRIEQLLSEIHNETKDQRD